MMNVNPNWFFRIKVIFFSVILSNMYFSWQTKCFSDGVSACVNPDYIGQNYMWSAAGFMVAVVILFIYDVGRLPPNDM